MKSRDKMSTVSKKRTVIIEQLQSLIPVLKAGTLVVNLQHTRYYELCEDIFSYGFGPIGHPSLYEGYPVLRGGTVKRDYRHSLYKGTVIPVEPSDPVYQKWQTFKLAEVLSGQRTRE